MRNRIIFLACAAFFLRFTAFGAFAPYISLWLKHSGHTTETIGGLYSLYRLCSFLSPVVVGGLADARKCHRHLFVALTIVNAAAVVCLTIFPRSVAWQAVGLMMISLTDTSSLVDAMVMRCLTWAGAQPMAPKCRAFGALAWCAVAPIYGEIANEFGISVLYRSYAPLLLLALPFVAALPSNRAYRETAEGKPPAEVGTEPPAAAATTAAEEVGCASAHAEKASSDVPASAAEPIALPVASATRGTFMQRLRTLGRSRRALVLLSLLFLVGVHFGIAFGFGFPYLEAELHATGLQIGLTLTAQALLEVPLFQVAGPLVRHFGLRQALLTCQLAACFRFTGWVAVTDAWWVLPFESGHGWSFALMYTCSSLFAEEWTSVGLQATVLGAAQSAQQAGSLVATMTWTALISAFGMRTAFLLAASLFGLASTPLLLEAPAVVKSSPQTWRLLSTACQTAGRRARRGLVRCCCCAGTAHSSLLAAGTVSSSSCSSSSTELSPAAT